jgi:AcrR family transcriptional regulator
MRASAKEKRRCTIEDAATDLLEEVGYDGLSMLSVARRAKASNETLYRWYGDKSGLFRSLVIRNASLIRSRLEEDFSPGRPALDQLRDFGPALLRILLEKRAIALNRAAAADASGELGATLAREGRDAISPVLKDLLSKAQDDGFLPGMDLDAAVQLYLSVLIGDLQIRCVTHAIPQPLATDIDQRADWAWQMLLRLSTAGQKKTAVTDGG